VRSGYNGQDGKQQAVEVKELLEIVALEVDLGLTEEKLV
jgi:hypothetical protein